VELDPFKLERTRQRLAAAGLDAALSTDFYNVAYLTGYGMPLEHGPSPFTRGFAAALFTPERVTLVAERPAGQTTADAWSGVTVPYTGYSFRGPPLAPTSAIETVCQVAVQELPRRGSVGVELAHLPAAIWTLLNDLLPDVTWVDLPPSLMLHVRAVKSPLELERLRACARLAEVGQAAARRLLREPSLSEI
jgi:Xaa-Pro aminopeptidase